MLEKNGFHCINGRQRSWQGIKYKYKALLFNARPTTALPSLNKCLLEERFVDLRETRLKLSVRLYLMNDH